MYPSEILKNFSVAKIFLPVNDEGTVQLDCVIHATTPPHFEVSFLPGQLPVQKLNLHQSCKIFYSNDGQNHILNSQIVQILSEEKLLLMVKRTKTFQHDRDYFRVDSPGVVRYHRVLGQNADIMEFDGMLNISGGGIRFPVKDSFSLNQKLHLELDFVYPDVIDVCCLGEVVRAQNFGRNKYVALKFLEMELRVREKLISFCMAVQREELRTKVRIADFS